VSEKKKVGLLYIAPVRESNTMQYDILKCPVCKRGRLCDVLHSGIVTVRSEQDTGSDGIAASVVVKCPKCSSKFIIYIQN